MAAGFAGQEEEEGADIGLLVGTGDVADLEAVFARGQDLALRVGVVGHGRLDDGPSVRRDRGGVAVVAHLDRLARQVDVQVGAEGEGAFFVLDGHDALGVAGGSEEQDVFSVGGEGVRGEGRRRNRRRLALVGGFGGRRGGCLGFAGLGVLRFREGLLVVALSVIYLRLRVIGFLVRFRHDAGKLAETGLRGFGFGQFGRRNLAGLAFAAAGGGFGGQVAQPRVLFAGLAGAFLGGGATAARGEDFRWGFGGLLGEVIHHHEGDGRHAAVSLLSGEEVVADVETLCRRAVEVTGADDRGVESQGAELDGDLGGVGVVGLAQEADRGRRQRDDKGTH